MPVLAAAQLVGLGRSAPPIGSLFLPDDLFEPTGTFREGWRPEYRVTRDYPLHVGGVLVLIPKGYVTDLYSLPGRLLQAWQPHRSLWWGPALAHDVLYDLGELHRSLCDFILLELMHDAGVAPIHRVAVYSAVRLGGGHGFNKCLPVNMAVINRVRAMPILDQLAGLQLASL